MRISKKSIVIGIVIVVMFAYPSVWLYYAQGPNTKIGRIVEYYKTVQYGSRVENSMGRPGVVIDKREVSIDMGNIQQVLVKWDNNESGPNWVNVYDLLGIE